MTEKRLLTPRHFRDLAASPNGRYLASLWEETNKRTVIVQDINCKGSKLQTLLILQLGLIGALNRDNMYQCAISMNGVPHVPEQL